MIRRTFPLFCPQILYKDRFGGNIQPFQEMNPAIFFDTDTKEWIVLVRGVSYRKYLNNVFTCFLHPLQSIYWIGRGHAVDNLSWQQLKYDLGLPTYRSYWNGVEDIRFVTKDTILCCVPQLHPNGKPSIFKATIDYTRNVLTSFQPCSPNATTEKNWMPFGTSSVIYNVSPFVVKQIDRDEQHIVPLSAEMQATLEGYHGSTNGVPYTGGWLFLIHKNLTNKVIHRWLFWKDSAAQVQVTDPFTFFKDAYIEFPCGLVQENGSLYVSLGVNDCQAFVLELEGLPSFH